MKMTEYRLETPLSEENVRKLKLGDIVYLSGTIYSGTHFRAKIIEAIKKSEKQPFYLKGAVFSHGATTSARYQALTPEFIKHAGIRAIIGKGSVDKPALDAMKTHGCVYLSLVGGATGPTHSLSSRRYQEGVEERFALNWPEPGRVDQWPSPSMIGIKVKDYGPLFVTMDAHGHSVETELEKELKEKLPRISKRIGAHEVTIPYHL